MARDASVEYDPALVESIENRTSSRGRRGRREPGEGHAVAASCLSSHPRPPRRLVAFPRARRSIFLSVCWQSPSRAARRVAFEGMMDIGYMAAGGPEGRRALADLEAMTTAMDAEMS